MKPELVYSARRHQQDLREADDRRLLAALAEGDEAALDVLIERKTGPLLQLCHRSLGDLEEARDVVQVAFVRIWESRSRYDPRWSPNTWIYRIASNLAIDRLRARRLRDREAEPVRHHLRQVAESGAGSHLERVEQREVMDIFQELAADLTEKQRMVFLLREVEGMSSPEVARVLGCRSSTVRNHLFNARKRLRTALEERYPEYCAGRSPGDGDGA